MRNVGVAMNGCFKKGYKMGLKVVEDKNWEHPVS
jgi:hypothetical protein